MPPAINPVPVPEVRGAAGLTFAASAPLGYIFTHDQGANVNYTIVDWWPNMEMGAMWSCGSATTNHTNVCDIASASTTKKVVMGMYYWAVDSIVGFNTSGMAGCAPSAVSANADCTATTWTSSLCPEMSAVNTFQCMSAVVSSLDSSTGMGTSGQIVYEPGRYTRARCQDDIIRLGDQSYAYVVVDSPFGPNNEYINDPNIMRNFINQVNVVFKTGGWLESPTLLASPTPTYSNTVGLGHWDTNMLC